MAEVVGKGHNGQKRRLQLLTVKHRVTIIGACLTSIGAEKMSIGRCRATVDCQAAIAWVRDGVVGGGVVS